MQIRRNLGHLRSCLIKIVQFKPRHLQIRILQYHRFRNDKLSDQIHQHIHLADVYTDKGCLFRLLWFVLCKLFGLSRCFRLDDKVTRRRGLGLLFLLDLSLCLCLCLDLLHTGIQINANFRTNSIKALLKLGRRAFIDIYLFDIIPRLYDGPKFLLGTLGL